MSLDMSLLRIHHGQYVEIGFGKVVQIFSIEAYEKFVKANYSGIGSKMKRLLMDDIPGDVYRTPTE